MTIAYFYPRFSSKAQADGASEQRQREAAEAFCRRKRLILDDTLDLSDRGVSAYKGENVQKGALGRFLELVNIGRVERGSYLIVESFDRLSRQEPRAALGLLFALIDAGIIVVTLNPEHEFTAKNMTELGPLILAVVEMSRANSESNLKGDRVADAAERRRKRAREGGKVFTKIAPAWLRRDEDRQRFVPIPDAVAAVLRIFKLSQRGYGVLRIAQELNRDGVPAIGSRATQWYGSYVRQILRNRAAVGEWQPHKKDGKRRVPVGDPVPNYYPAIMTEDEWWSAQTTLNKRKLQRGPVGKRVRNLFTGLIRNARDGLSMVIKGPARPGMKTYWVGSGALIGAGDATGIMYPCEDFEFYFLQLLSARDVPGLLAKNSGEKESVVAALTGELTHLHHQRRVIEEVLDQEGESKLLLQRLAVLERKTDAKSLELAEAKGKQATNDAETLGEARSLFSILQTCPPEQLLDLRTRLKARLHDLIKEVWVLIEGDRKQKVAHTQVFFENGNVLCFDAHHPPRRGVCFEDGTDGQRRVSTTKFPLDIHGWIPANPELQPECDLRKWRELPQRPDSDGKKWAQPGPARELRVVPVIVDTSKRQAKAKRRSAD